jgi:hypothetical protein
MAEYICCNCDAQTSAPAERETPAGEAVFIEAVCPSCGSDDIEDAVNLANVREAKALLHFMERVLKPTHYGAQLGMDRPEIPLPELDV